MSRARGEQRWGGKEEDIGSTKLKKDPPQKKRKRRRLRWRKIAEAQRCGVVYSVMGELGPYWGTERTE